MTLFEIGLALLLVVGTGCTGYVVFNLLSPK